MNKKKLPKAIRRTTDDKRVAAAEHGAPGEAALARSADGGAAAPDAADASDVVDNAPGPAASSSVAAAALVPQASPAAGLDAARRLSRARAIVERHAAYSAVGGVIPLPIVNVASITAIIVRMVKKLSDLYGVPFERDRARAIVVGLVVGSVPTGLATVTTSTLFYVVPASALLGLAVSSITAAACTRSIGRIFVEHFESGATLEDFSAIART